MTTHPRYRCRFYSQVLNAWLPAALGLQDRQMVEELLWLALSVVEDAPTVEGASPDAHL